ncbi:MAG: NAD(P)/FAD-dependent oxidoreductase [Desulfobacterales bacterium]|nr:NAD(P)/FAD-dependent oxidoreductase [Desulfobacterales bacterium]
MPTNDHYVIIGNGPAGNHAAYTLREKDKDAKITIVSDEAIPFYSKPKLTRYILDEIDSQDLLVKQLSSYSETGIRLRLGQEVDSINPATHTVFLHHKEEIHYTKLIIASGSRARVLPSMRPYASCLKFISSYNQVVEYKEEIRNANEFFIFGGDLVGFKFLRLLAKMGKKITLLIYPNAFWPFNLNDEMEAVIEKSLSGLDVDLVVKDDISAITESGAGYRVTTQKGKEKQVDMVFSFNGLVPSVDFARGCGLDIDHGILVDETMRTNNPDIYACGSCAQVYNPNVNAYTTSIGWPNAVVQGEVTAMNLLGDYKVIESVGRKYFDLEGVKIKTTWWEDIEEA